MSLAPNAIVELLDENGALKSSLGNLSIDTLRLALSQLIDGLERLEEVGQWITQAGDWHAELSSRKAWDNTMFGHGGVLQTTERQDFSEGDPAGIGSVQWGAAGHQVSQLPRKDVEAAIRSCFDYADRYRRLGETLAADSARFLAGVALQSEGLKDHGPDPDAAPRKRPSPGRR
mgnify:CR=1 FL=1